MGTFKGWRTIIFNSVIAILGVLEATNWVDVIGEQWGGIALLAIGLIGVWLCKITTTPVGKGWY